jgi:hypothetical protein
VAPGLAPMIKTVRDYAEEIARRLALLEQEELRL